MEQLIADNNLKIEDMIYEIRGKQVMLDSDLAKLYQCKNGTKEINQAVKNNLEKFPERFSWKLSEQDAEYFLVKKFDQNVETRGGRYKNPRVFTEQGVAMLATILKSKIAIQVSISIMDAFVEMRSYLSSNNYERRISNIETKLIDYDRKFDEVFDRLEPKIRNHLFFEGQIYDAYSLLVDLLNSAKENIILIDNYVDKKFLDIIAHVKVKVTLITSNKCNLTNIDIEKYNKEYSNLEIVYNSNFHDRFILIDNKDLYHVGSSLKDLGKKCFAINRIEEIGIIENLKSKLVDEEEIVLQIDIKDE